MKTQYGKRFPCLRSEKVSDLGIQIENGKGQV